MQNSCGGAAKKAEPILSVVQLLELIKCLPQYDQLVEAGWEARIRLARLGLIRGEATMADLGLAHLTQLLHTPLPTRSTAFTGADGWVVSMANWPPHVRAAVEGDLDIEPGPGRPERVDLERDESNDINPGGTA